MFSKASYGGFQSPQTTQDFKPSRGRMEQNLSMMTPANLVVLALSDARASFVEFGDLYDNEDPRLRFYEAMKIGEASIGVSAANHTRLIANVVLGTRCFEILWRRYEK